MLTTRKIVIISLLSAIAIVLSVVEGFIPSFGIPGIKLGLANIIILLSMYEIGIKEALIINVVRILLGNILRGRIFDIGFLMSFTGATLSFLIMMVFCLWVKRFSIIGVSVIGSFFHIFGQVLVAMIYLESGYILYYLPFLGISALVTGIFVGLVALLIQKSKIISNSLQK